MPKRVTYVLRLEKQGVTLNDDLMRKKKKEKKVGNNVCSPAQLRMNDSAPQRSAVTISKVSCNTVLE